MSRPKKITEIKASGDVVIPQTLDILKESEEIVETPEVIENTIVVSEELVIETSPYIDIDLSTYTRSKVCFIQNLLPEFPNVTKEDILNSRFKIALSTLIKLKE